MTWLRWLNDGLGRLWAALLTDWFPFTFTAAVFLLLDMKPSAAIEGGERMTFRRVTKWLAWGWVMLLVLGVVTLIGWAVVETWPTFGGIVAISVIGVLTVLAIARLDGDDDA